MKKNRNLRYLTREGIKNIGVNRIMSFASIAVLMSCLVMIGFAVLLFFNIDTLVHRIEAQNVIMVFVSENADEQTISTVETELNKVENIQTVTFVAKEEGYDNVLKSLGENADIFNGIDASFLPDGFQVTVNDMSAFVQTVDQIKHIEGVVHVRENSDLAARLEKVRTAVTYVSIGVIILLLVVALFIIANTIRVTMYTRRLEISIMKAVGATNWFIRWPFLIEGISIGFISAVLSLGVLYLIYYLAGEALRSIFGVFGGTLISFMDYAPYIFVAFLIISFFTSGIGSIFSIRKYLKEQGSVVDAAN